MFSFIIALVLIFVALLAIALRKTYESLPPKELKRQARAGDPLAKVLYQAVAYGASLQVLLWIVIVLAIAGSFVLFAQIAPPVLAFIIDVLIIVMGFVWIPATRLTSVGSRIALWLTPVVAWTLRQLHPILDRIVLVVCEYRPLTVHTGLYEKDDLLTLVERQKDQADSRISNETLDLLAHALTFGERSVREVMVPRKVVRMVDVKESVTPVVIQDLHASGHSRFPVFEDTEENVVGTLHLSELVDLKQSGRVGDVMDKTVYYVHEEYPLEQVLDAFTKSKHHLFVVVNQFEEYVGIITIEDILEQILGYQIVDEFDQYDNMRAVAQHHAHAEHDHHKKVGEEAVKDPAAAKPEAIDEKPKTNSEAQDKVK